MQSNADLFKIAQLIRVNQELSHLLIVTPGRFMMDKLRSHPQGGAVVKGLTTFWRPMDTRDTPWTLLNQPSWRTPQVRLCHDVAG